MAKITVEIKSDSGEVIGTLNYDLGDSLQTIDLIESSVEAFRLSALPAINAALLESEQLCFKKNDFSFERELSSDD